MCENDNFNKDLVPSTESSVPSSVHLRSSGSLAVTIPSGKALATAHNVVLQLFGLELTRLSKLEPGKWRKGKQQHQRNTTIYGHVSEQEISYYHAVPVSR